MSRSWMAACAAALCLAWPAHATAPDPALAATVQAAPAQVTLSRAQTATSQALDSYASFQASLVNSGASAISRAVFKAIVSSDQAAVTVDSVSGLPAGAACTGLGTTIAFCELGALAAGASVNLFVIVRAPTVGTRIDLSYFADGDGCCSLSGSASAQLRDPASDTQSLVRTTSFVPPVGGEFFTGSGRAATAADPWLTFVTVPGRPGVVTTLEINEASIPALASNLFTGESSELNMPGAFSSLRIVLRRDASTIARHAKIHNARVYYAKKSPDGSYPPGPGLELFDCTAAGPAPGVPCIESRTDFKKKNAPAPEWIGDWEFVIRALDNGRYNQ